MCVYKKKRMYVCTRLCCEKEKETEYVHGMCIYEIQTTLKRKCDWVHLGSPEALYGNTETRICIKIGLHTDFDRKHLFNP